MAHKENKEINNLTRDELVVQIRETRKDFFNARIQSVTGQLGNTRKPWALRKRIARLETRLNHLDRQSASSQSNA